MTINAPRACRGPGCTVVFTPTARNARYCGDDCRRRAKNAWARQNAKRVDGHAKGTRTAASDARAGTVRRVPRPLVWIGHPVPASVMAEARAEYDRQLAAVPKRAGRPKGGKVSA